MLFWVTRVWQSANASITFSCQSRWLRPLVFTSRRRKCLWSVCGVGTLCTKGEEHFCRLYGLWWRPSDPEKVTDILRDNRARWQITYSKYLNTSLASHDLQTSNSEVNSQSTSVQLPSQSEQKGKSDMNLVSAAICRSVSSAFTMYRKWHNSGILAVVKSVCGFRDEREMFLGYCLIR